MPNNLGLGTLEVRSYVNSWGTAAAFAKDAIPLPDLYPTSGPENRFKFALFIEKEGSNPLLAASKIAERYDLAIFSSKGQSTTATRELVDRLSQAGVIILVAHDFDISGLSIVHNLGHDSRRYTFVNKPDVRDIGLRLEDVDEMGLQNEPVDFKKKKKKKNPSDKLLDYDDVTAEEMAFLVDGGCPSAWTGKRVELNAMTSGQFVAWLERKLKWNGATKVIPNPDILADAWQRADRAARIQDAITDVTEEIDSETLTIPKNLGVKIRKLLKQEPELSWDQAIVRIAEAEKK
jgi:Protein of unknown function C-terminus (DUF2399)